MAPVTILLELQTCSDDFYIAKGTYFDISTFAKKINKMVFKKFRLKKEKKNIKKFFFEIF